MRSATIQDAEEAQQMGKLKEDVMYGVYAGLKVHGKKIYHNLAWLIQNTLGDKVVLAETSDGLIIDVNISCIYPLSKGGSAFTPRKPRRKPTKGTRPERKVPVGAGTEIKVGDIVKPRWGKRCTVARIGGNFMELSDGRCAAKANLEYIIIPYQEPAKERVSYRIGDRFTSPIYGDHILAMVGPYKVCLIGLKDGNRFVEPVTTRHISIVSEEEFAQISGGESLVKL